MNLEFLKNKKIKMSSFKSETQFKEFKDLSSDELKFHRIEHLEFKNLHSLYIDNEFEVNFINNSTKADDFFADYNFEVISAENCINELKRYNVFTHYGVETRPTLEEIETQSIYKKISELLIFKKMHLSILATEVVGIYFERYDSYDLGRMSIILSHQILKFENIEYTEFCEFEKDFKNYTI